MSDDIKVGDVCVIVAPASTNLVGSECEVIGPEKVYEKKIGGTDSMDVIAWCNGFMVRVASDGKRYVLERQCLRKKRPPADEMKWIRQETMPRRDFEQWLDDVKRESREMEVA